MKRFSMYAVTAMIALLSSSAWAVDVKIDTAPARAVLRAIGNPRLTHEQALQVASMPGNDGPVRELRSFKIDVTKDDLADAIYKTAHSEPITRQEQRDFLLDWVKPRLNDLNALLDYIDKNPESFQDSIRQRISLYTPAGAPIHLVGYVVAAGDGGGYAFGSTDFYLNLVWVGELPQAKSVTTHEMYHAVQGYYRKYRYPSGEPDEHAPQTVCSSLQRLFSSMYEEGTAVEVSDVRLISQFKTANALRQKVDMEEGMKHLSTSVALLDMSVTALEANQAVPYDDVYGVGFFGHGILYNISYVIARDIAQDDGPAGLAGFLQRPPVEFLQRYTELRQYGKDAEHPKLGPNTIEAIDKLAKGCH